MNKNRSKGYTDCVSLTAYTRLAARVKTLELELAALWLTVQDLASGRTQDTARTNDETDTPRPSA